MHGLPEGLQRKIQRSVIFWIASVAVVLVDQASKVWALGSLKPLHPGAISVIPKLLQLQYAENTGAAFSLFEQYPAILTGIASLLAAGVLVWSFLLPAEERLSRISLGLIFGGAVGNLIDRFSHGFVVDFIQLHWQGRPIWPTFNIADSAICVGIGLFFLASWMVMRQQQQAQSAAQSPSTKAQSVRRSS